jgi:hypothetical protein
MHLAPSFAENPIKFQDIPFKESAKKAALNGSVLVVSNVEDQKLANRATQSLDFKILGVHTKSCKFALRKLSQYENFSKYVGIIDKSHYSDKKKLVSFYLSSPILPIDMWLRFKIPRIKKIGVYPFKFEQGFLKGLVGKIHVSQRHKSKKCYFYSEAHWKGPDTGFASFLMEFFSTTLSRMAMSTLIRISKVY